MNIYGHQVTPEQDAAMTARMAAGRFRAFDITRAAELAGVPIAIRLPNRHFPENAAHRASDRLIQRERKAGKIRLIGKGPDWEPTAAR